MKNGLAALLLATALIAIDPSDAAAWYCRAESANSYGWGSDRGQAHARRRALTECARRTPRSRRCFIVYCRPT